MCPASENADFHMYSLFSCYTYLQMSIKMYQLKCITLLPIRALENLMNKYLFNIKKKIKTSKLT